MHTRMCNDLNHITEVRTAHTSSWNTSSLPSKSSNDKKAKTDPDGMWRSESSTRVFKRGSVRPITRAQDALTHAEEAVYDFLWGRRDGNRDEYRLKKAGYTEISTAARVSKRKTANILVRLEEKGFLAVETPADPLSKTPATYRVHSYRKVLEALDRAGRWFVARAGNGVLFVSPVEENEQLIPKGIQTAAEARSKPSTVDRLKGSTVDHLAGLTVDRLERHPYREFGESIKSGGIRRTSSASVCRVIHECLRKWGIYFDDAAIHQLVIRCRMEDGAATEDEIATFLALKIAQLKNNPTVRSMTGLLLTAVPAYFAWPATQLNAYREQKAEDASNCYEAEQQYA